MSSLFGLSGRWPMSKLWSGPFDEASKFSDPGFGQDDRRLDQNAVAPTALHSWGNPLRGCPCGCRLSGFSLERLLQSGLRGIGIHSLVLERPRHIHPQEAGLLNGVPPLDMWRIAVRHYAWLAS